MKRARAVPKRADQTPEAVVVLLFFLCLLSGATWLALSLYTHRPL